MKKKIFILSTTDYVNHTNNPQVFTSLEKAQAVMKSEYDEVCTDEDYGYFDTITASFENEDTWIDWDIKEFEI